MTPTWTALVTAGTSGIGRAATETLARDGVTVIVTGRAAMRGEEVVSAIGADGGDARFSAADLPVPADVSRLAGEVGDVDILVNAKGGSAIINVSTMVADFGMAGMSAYEVSKAATNLLTKAWAAEYGPLGVRVNAVSPGPSRTPGSAPMGEDLDRLASTLPLGRPADAEEIAETIRFLASEGTSFINGAIVAVEGGPRTAA
jgi:NAD(P)-dependent dehydrogenase (short-subunit alcohol dehydrogenase family)